MVAAYFYIKYNMKPEKMPNLSKQNIVEQEHAEELEFLGNTIYMCTALACVISFLNYKVYLGKSWEYSSVLTGIYLCKAAMLVTVQGGPLLYSCLLA